MVAMRLIVTGALETLTRTGVRISLAMLAGLFFVVFIDLAGAQSLINTGSINNTGLIRVKDQAVGLPSRIDGVFEFFGANQQVPAKQYSHLVLSGSGTKTTIGGSFTVTDSISIATAVTLRVECRCSITLNGTLTEGGYLAGMIQRRVDLSGSTSSSDFGNIGATISWVGLAPGSTSVTRGSDSSLTGDGHQSIKRFYNIVPDTNNGLNATLVFRYSNNELNRQNPAALSLWRSTDSGATWRKQGGTIDVASGTITKTGITSFSLWTAADSDHPLGPSTIEGVPSSIALAAGNNATGPINTSVNPFVVIVTDGYGDPVPGVSVTFAITSVPYGASGQSLSVTTTVTDNNGQAVTVLQLGDVAGSYTVSATSSGMIGSPVVFNATAIKPVVLLVSQGWNMISSFVSPKDSTLDTILVRIKPRMVIMKNGAGQIYWPAFGINTIGSWNYRQGYQMYMQSADTLSITGPELTPQGTSISLVQGWNLVAYLRNSPMRADSALAGIVNNLVIAKNNVGQVYWPTFSINTIGSMKPGQGYQMYLTQASTLFYPANSGSVPASLLSKAHVIADAADVPSPAHYRLPVSNTGANAILLVESPELNQGDEIAVWTAKKMLVGSGLMSQGKALVTIWGDNSITGDILEGAVDGESLLLTVWSAGDHNERSLSISSLRDALTGREIANTLHYKTDAVWIVRVTGMKQIPESFSLSQNYPNPFNPSTTIKYGLPHDTKVTLEIYGVLGQLVAVAVDEEQKAGYYEIVFANSGLASGVYFYRLQAGSFIETKKMMILR